MLSTESFSEKYLLFYNSWTPKKGKGGIPETVGATIVIENGDGIFYFTKITDNCMEPDSVHIEQ